MCVITTWGWSLVVLIWGEQMVLLCASRGFFWDTPLKTTKNVRPFCKIDKAKILPGEFDWLKILFENQRQILKGFFYFFLISIHPPIKISPTQLLSHCFCKTNFLTSGKFWILDCAESQKIKDKEYSFYYRHP